MAAKKSKKPGKTLGKKSMKKTKGGAVDAFINFSTAPTLNTNTSLNNTINGGTLNFLK